MTGALLLGNTAERLRWHMETFYFVFLILMAQTKTTYFEQWTQFWIHTVEKGCTSWLHTENSISIFTAAQRSKYRRNSLKHRRVNKCTPNYSTGRVWKARSLGKKSLNYLGRHTGEGQFAKTGKICLSRDVQNHGAKRQRREFPSQDMIPCATLYILNQGGSQYTADFFFLCLFTSGYINSNLLLRQREKEKM